jgi:hypothetical protein
MNIPDDKESVKASWRKVEAAILQSDMSCKSEMSINMYALLWLRRIHENEATQTQKSGMQDVLGSDVKM